MASEMGWEIEEDGPWYRVTARATCPNCGAPLSHEDLRRVAAGPPETPELTLTVAADSSVELSAVGYIFPMLTHRCETPKRRS
jgi:hypothetical protein